MLYKILQEIVKRLKLKNKKNDDQSAEQSECEWRALLNWGIRIRVQNTHF